MKMNWIYVFIWILSLYTFLCAFWCKFHWICSLNLHTSKWKLIAEDQFLLSWEQVHWHIISISVSSRFKWKNTFYKFTLLHVPRNATKWTHRIQWVRWWSDNGSGINSIIALCPITIIVIVPFIHAFDTEIMYLPEQ